MPISPVMQRLKAAKLVQRRLEHDSYPRLQMSLLVLLTGGAGFLTSFVLLHMGYGAMGVRYFLSMCVAYGAFLLLLGAWLRFQVEDLADQCDLVDSSGDLADVASVGLDMIPSGSGGTFDGIGDTLGAVGDADELAIPIILFFIALLVIGLVLSCLFVVYSAPALFSEIVVDALLSASLYRRLKGLERTHWLETAVRRTVLPFVLTTIIVTMSGVAMNKMFPGAHSMGEALFAAKAVPAK